MTSMMFLYFHRLLLSSIFPTFHPVHLGPRIPVYPNHILCDLTSHALWTDRLRVTLIYNIYTLIYIYIYITTESFVFYRIHSLAFNLSFIFDTQLHIRNHSYFLYYKWLLFDNFGIRFFINYITSVFGNRSLVIMTMNIMNIMNIINIIMQQILLSWIFYLNFDKLEIWKLHGLYYYKQRL